MFFPNRGEESKMQKNDPFSPRGGNPSLLANDEIECMYCSRSVPRTSFQRTCPACAKQWVAEFGPTWFEQDWHTTQIADHVRTFGGNDRKSAEALTETMDD